MDARKNLNEKIEKQIKGDDGKDEDKKQDKKETKKAKEEPTKDAKKATGNKFKRVAIEESSSDEEANEPKIEDLGGKETNEGQSSWWGTKNKVEIESKFPLMTK